MVSKRTSLTLAALTSTILWVAQAHSDVTVNVDEVAQRSTSVDGNITIDTTGSITTNGTSAVKIDSGNLLTITPNNVSGQPPGITMTNNPVLTDGAVNVSADNGQIKIGVGSGITADDGHGVLVNANTAIINNSGSITGGSTDGSGADGIHFESGKANPSIINQGTGANEVLTGDRAGIYFDSTTGITLKNEAGNTIASTATTAAGRYGVVFNGNSTGTLTNNGTISTATTSATSAAIFANNGGSTLTIDNNTGATLSSNKGMGIHFSTATANFNATINNAGTITAETDGIRLDDNGATVIHNKTSGVINAGQSGILLNDKIDGSITNDGTINANNKGIEISANSDVIVLNNGTINNVGGNTSGALQVGATGASGSITNAGTLNVTGASTSANAIRISSPFTGNITNSGSATTTAGATFYNGDTITGNVVNSGTLSLTTDAMQSVVVIDGNITGSFTNSGIISSASTTTTAVDINVAITGGFINSGSITLGAANLTAIDFAGSGAMTLTNTGTIGGNINATNASANTINMNSGLVSGNIALGANANTINISGGSITGTMDGNSNNDILNVLGDFTSVSAINGFHTITVQNAGTEFTATAPINNIAAGGTFTVAPGATFLTTSMVTDAGALTLSNQGIFGVGDGGMAIFNQSNFLNDGTVAIGNGGAYLEAISVDHTAAGNSTYAFEVTDTTDFGVIKTSSAATDVTNDSFVMVLNGEGFIETGDLFKVLDNQGNAITGANTINVSTDILVSGIETLGQESLTLSFINVNNANDITLQAVRTPFQAVSNSGLANTIAMALDGLINDPLLHPDLQSFISQLDILSSAAEVTASLETLAPLADNGLVEMSNSLHNNAVNTVIGRLNNSRSFYDFWKGISSGDDLYYGIGTWGQVFASRISQNAVDGSAGYKASVSGFTLGADKMLDYQWTLGGAFTFGTGDLESRRGTSNETDLTALQLTLYGTYDSVGAWYFDTIASAGLNRYKGKRLIQAGTFQRTASSDYKAWQYSLQGIGGYNFSYEKYRITPILGLRYGMLDSDPYTEQGAGGVGLTVEPKTISELVASFGVRFSSVHEAPDATYVPEMRIMAHYDFLRDNQESTSNFISNGSVYFNTHGPKPDPLTYNIGFAVTAYSGDYLSFSMNYDFEWKSQFLSHSGFLKLKYVW